jgi:RNA polymerase sigma-70 factor (ECF subfamily)
VQRAGSSVQNALLSETDSPFERMAHEEVRARVEQELRKVAEPYRTTVILRDLEELSYEEIAEITQVSLGTVKSRLTRGREALKQRLKTYVREVGPELGLESVAEETKFKPRSRVSCEGREIEVAS